MNITEIAKACHSANAGYCVSIGDTSQPAWDDAPEWMRKSAEEGVKYFIDNPEVTPEDQHEAWKKSKTDDGWVYGDIKDPDKKTHPCIVDYDKLPEEQRKKDVIFQNTIKEFME